MKTGVDALGKGREEGSENGVTYMTAIVAESRVLCLFSE